MPDPLLAVYDAQLRRSAEVLGADDVVEFGPVLWARFGRRGLVTYRSLDAAHLDALITATIAHFRDATGVDEFEWKTRGHDRAARLDERLRSRGFRPGEPETVMAGEVDGPAVRVEVPSGVTVRRQAGRHAGATLWFAEAAGEVVGTGRLEIVPGTGFAGLWGGATVPQWRRRGIYRALTSARARYAQRHGVRYLYADCTEMSRPVLERGGLRPITTTTPYLWRRGG